MTGENETEDTQPSGGSRLPELLRASKGAAWLAQQTGISRRMIDRYRAGAEPTLSNAVRIAMALNVPLSALAPEGSFRDVDVGDLQRSLADRDTRILQLEGTIAQMSLAQSIRQQSAGDTVPIPRLNVRLAAGIGRINYHDRDDIDQIPISSSLLSRLGIQKSNAYFIQVEGDSMESTIFDRDDVLINAGDTNPKPNGIYAVRYGEAAMLKRVQSIPMLGIVSLLSDNEDFEPISVKRGEQDQFSVMGRARLVMRVL